jgi:nucleoside-diphosphate-sugar epimerase
MNAQQKILVTGATGFIGQHVMNELIKHDVNIIATGRDQSKVQSKAWYGRVTFIPFDLNKSQDDFFSFFGKPDILIHLSWEGLPHYAELYHYERNLMQQYCFLKNMVQRGLQKLVVSGTCFEYGLQEGCLAESNCTNPNTCYGLAKDTLRKFLQALQQQHPFTLQWLRLFYLYGEGQSPTSLLAQLEAALAQHSTTFNMSPGDQQRDYLPVEQVAKYIVTIALNYKESDIMNIGSGKPITVKQLVEKYLQDNHKKINLNLGYYDYAKHEPFAFWADVRKLRHLDF